MEGISDIRIIGLDENRPPLIRKEPYIDLYFKLSHKAPAAWCNEFNNVASKQKYDTKIDDADGLYIRTWVRSPDEIAAHLKIMQALVRACTANYIDKINAARLSAGDKNTDLSKEGGEQGRLNRIVAELDFSDKA
ncbi:MAG: hypothetical protein CVV05_07700 [Gammaproteobacteria bacterium HGW-Gammaproteobacteria-1]|jgi:hypothetical protein|nr:MAG: hypothetical protein CVV05_07700 [Gammaproteobacteria bacterium HGW-Gammaproteobacteria-1]